MSVYLNDIHSGMSVYLDDVMLQWVTLDQCAYRYMPYSEKTCWLPTSAERTLCTTHCYAYDWNDDDYL